MLRRFFAAACAWSLLLGFAHSGQARGARNQMISWSGFPSQFHSRNRQGIWPRIPCKPDATIALGAYYFDNGMCAPGDTGAVSSFRARTGRTPAVWMIFQSWEGWNQFPIEQARRARSLGSTLMVTWEPWNGVASDPNWNCQNVVSGRYDSYIRSYARSVRAAHAPVMIRLGHEMNGSWYPWGTAYAGCFQRNNNNSPAMFCAMWKHVVSLFREQGASNAKWVWSPNILFLDNWNDERSQERDLMTLYPGDAWVDWVGVSVYNDGAKSPWRSFRALFDTSYRLLSQISTRPMMIAEMGVTEQGAPAGQTKAAWLEQALLSDIPKLYDRVRLVTYFCRNKSGTGESDYRFDSSPASLAAFREVANSPIYSGVVD
jgi:hypothetical protein